MMKHVLLLAIVTLCFACKNTNEHNADNNIESLNAKVPTLKLLWQTDTLMTTSESVIYDEENDVIYSSNINGDAWESDGNGFISKIDMNGNTIEEKWVEGLHAPKGLGIYNGHLFVNDNSEIIDINTSTGKIEKRHPVPGTEKLNDITIGKDGAVYASTSDNFQVIALKGDKITTVLDSLDGPNGLLVEGDELLILLWNPKTLSSVDLSTKKMTLVSENLENPDGVEAVGNGGYLVSSWQGLIHYIDPEGNRQLLLDTSAEKIRAADIDYVPEKNLLLVPTFFDNRVMAYELIF